MPKHSKRFENLVKKHDLSQPLPLPRAVEVLKDFGSTKFDQTVEIHMRLGIDPKQADQIIRGSVVLPHGIGRTQRVVVFAKGDMVDVARQAGADEVGQEDLARAHQGRVAGLRRLHRGSRHDGAGRSARTRVGSPWFDAFAAGRHRDARRRQGRSRIQGRKGRVPQRLGRQRARRGGAYQLRCQEALGKRPGLH